MLVLLFLVIAIGTWAYFSSLPTFTKLDDVQFGEMEDTGTSFMIPIKGRGKFSAGINYADNYLKSVSGTFDSNAELKYRRYDVATNIKPISVDIEAQLEQKGGYGRISRKSYSANLS
jgi:hypothetical protein